ncbi:MAG: lytic murein transglycosylase [Methyloceanibacter sp.]|jgi:lytic murein transglycosylase|uniref:lytic murein transglycosylase n=1 Tax=Methyloceanibacter sp. TaxID=1965321 RepID=UPI003562350D
MAHKSLMALASAMLLFFATTAEAARCGKSAAGFEKWKRAFAKEARANGIGQRGLNALKGTRYAYGTIKADRGQHSFKLSLNQFMKKRGASAIASQGKRLKRSNAKLLAAIERRYGVPAGPLLAIWGMETGFGRYMGRQNTLSAVATLAYDCRRPEFFTEHLYAALQLIDQRRLAAGQRGAMHGEVGHTQFLPKSVLLYAVDGDGNGRADLNSKADALASTANFLRGHGWQPGAGYQPGQPNFRAIQGWNAAGVYQQTIAIVGRQIDGG